MNYHKLHNISILWLLNKRQNSMVKGNNLLEEIKSTIVHTDKIVMGLFNSVAKCTLKNLFFDSQCWYNRKDIIRLLIIVKLLSFHSVHEFIKSDLKKLLPFKKDVIYKILNSYWINWRKHLLDQAKECYNSIELDTDNLSPHQTPCFIVDDSDLPKKGRCMELIGKIFSHVGMKFELGYKSLNLGIWTGKSFLHLDFSLHGELGKKKNQGLNKKQQAKRFNKSRPDKSNGKKRIDEYFKKKTTVAINMIKSAICKGFKAKYILVDSWFFNSQLVAFAKSQNLNLISRPKFNNWNYEYNEKQYTIGKLCQKFKYDKSKKWSKKYRMHYVEVKVIFKGTPLKIFFYKSKKRGTKWQAIITTNLKIGAIKAYEIYQNRWSIEVSYKELKQHLGLGKCQSTDFDAQIADATLCLISYNYLSTYKTANEYESIGGLFKQIAHQWLSPTIMQRFWNYLYKMLQQLAEYLEIELEKLLEKCWLMCQIS